MRSGRVRGRPAGAARPAPGAAPCGRPRRACGRRGRDGFPRLSRHEQGLRDLRIAVPLGGELRDPALRGGQLLYPRALRVARPASRRPQLRPGVLGERVCAAALGQFEPLLERGPSLRALVCPTEGGSQIDEGARPLEPCRRVPQDFHSLAEAGGPAGASLGQRAGAQRHADAPGGSPATRSLEIFFSHPGGSLVVSDESERDRSGRAPARRKWVGTTPALVAAAELEHVVEPLIRSALGHAEQATCFEQVVAGAARRDLIAQTALAERALGGGELALLYQRLDQEAQREPDSEQAVCCEELERRSRIGLRSPDIPAPQGDPPAPAGRIGQLRD
jgi:hypothetical protein